MTYSAIAGSLAIIALGLIANWLVLMNTKDSIIDLAKIQKNRCDLLSERITSLDRRVAMLTERLKEHTDEDVVTFSTADVEAIVAGLDAMTAGLATMRKGIAFSEDDES